jgi:hypothetical protein
MVRLSAKEKAVSFQLSAFSQKESCQLSAISFQPAKETDGANPQNWLSV